MSVMQHYSNQSPVPGIACPKYQPCAGSKRCQHYLDGGACSLASEFMCVEWLKRNGHHVPEHHPTRTMPPAQSVLFPTLVPANQGDVSAAPSAPGPAPRPSMAPMVPESMPAPVPAHPRAPITQDEIDSFKALGVELCIRSEELGEVWLVPRYSGQPRKEITPEHAATLRLLLEAFPGGRIVQFERLSKTATEGAQS